MINYDINKITLSFRDELEESLFLKHFYKKNIKYLRFVLLVGIFLFGLFGLLNFWSASDVAKNGWLVRYGILTPLIISVIGLSYYSSFYRHIEKVVALIIALAGSSLITMNVLLDGSGSELYSSGVLLMFLFAYGFTRMRFINASIAGLLIFAYYEIVSIFFNTMPVSVWVHTSFNLLMANVIGMMISFTLERQERLNFRQTNKIKRDKKRLSRLNRKLKEVSVRDPLTNLYNRRRLGDKINRRIKDYKNKNYKTSFVFIDLDNFKSVNEKYGHDTGDRVLKNLAMAIDKNKRTGDIAFRYGGDEFCLILPGANTKEALVVGNRILTYFISMQIRGVDVKRLNLGFSAGCSMINKSTKNANDLMKKADNLLFMAKKQGKGIIMKG